MADLTEMLGLLDGRMLPVLRRYDQNCLREEVAAILDGSVSFGGAQWRCEVTRSECKERDPSCIQLDVTFRVLSGAIDTAGVGLAFEFSDWQNDNYTMLPSAVYNGNDFVTRDAPYPPMWRDKAEFRLDMPITTTPIPKLSHDSSRIEQTTGDTSVPCMGFYSPSKKHGFLIVTEQGSRFGNHGLTVERCEDGACRFLLTAPSVRELRQEHCKASPSDDRGVSWAAGDEITLKLHVAVFEAPVLQVLFDRFCDLRKSTLNPSASRCELPFSAGWKIIEEKVNRDNWVEEEGFYKLAPNFHTTFDTVDKPLCFIWQVGWVGGGMMTLPMLALGNAETRGRAKRNLAMIFEKTQAPSGFFMGLGDGTTFYGDGFDTPSPHHLHMVRKSGDWLYFGIKQLELLKKQGEEVPEAWRVALRNLAEALAAGFFEEESYLQVAEAAATKYYQEFVCQGITTGGPGEILSAPDSESAFALVESFVALLEKTGQSFWATAAKEMVRQAATWVVAYDYDFPPESSLAKCDTRSTGAVWANVQNKHGAPGICTFSGDSLFRLWRLTGDRVALDLIKDIAHGIPQYLSRADRQLSSHLQPGWMCERVNLSDWEGAEGVGGSLFGSSSWPETALMLTCLELPGLSIQPDCGVVCAFDHIEAEVTGHDGNSLQLLLRNPTKFDAHVRVLAETSEQAQHVPLGAMAMSDLPVVGIRSGQRIEIKVQLETGSKSPICTIRTLSSEK